LLLVFFHLFMKKKMQRQMIRSMENLKEFCKPSFTSARMTVQNLN
jgi:hypothetical protein